MTVVQELVSAPESPLHTSLLFEVIVTASAVQARMSAPATVVAVYCHRASRGPCDGAGRRLVGVGSLCGSASGGSQDVRSSIWPGARRWVRYGALFNGYIKKYF